MLSKPSWTSRLFLFLIMFKKFFRRFKLEVWLACALLPLPHSQKLMTNQLWKIWCRLLFNFWFENAWIRGNSKATSLNENRKRTQSELFVSTLKTWFSRVTRYDSDKRKNLMKKYYWGRIENIWVTLWKFFLSSVRLTGVAISDQNPRSFQLTVVFE